MARMIESEAIRLDPERHIRTDVENGCWLWLRYRNAGGYGRFWIGDGRLVMAHRWFYEKYKGQIPDDKEIDHLCRVPACVNPAHLEAVPHAVNVLRGKGTHMDTCRSGHAVIAGNILFRGGRRHGCLTCARAAAARRMRRKRRDNPEFRARQAECCRRWRERQKAC